MLRLRPSLKLHSRLLKGKPACRAFWNTFIEAHNWAKALARRAAYDAIHKGPEWDGGSYSLTIKRQPFAGGGSPYENTLPKTQRSELSNIARFRKILGTRKWKLAAAGADKGMCIGSGRLDKQVKPGLGWAARAISLTGKRRSKREKRNSKHP